MDNTFGIFEGAMSPLANVLENIRNNNSNSSSPFDVETNTSQIPEPISPEADRWRGVFVLNTDQQDVAFNTYRKTKQTLQRGTKYFVEFIDGNEIPVSEFEMSYRPINPREISNYESYDDFYYRTMLEPTNPGILAQGIDPEMAKHEVNSLKKETSNPTLDPQSVPRASRNNAPAPVIETKPQTALSLLLEKAKKTNDVIPMDNFELDNLVSKDLIRILMETTDDINPDDLVDYIIDKNKARIEAEIRKAVNNYYFSSQNI